MPVIEFEALTTPVSPDDPCGPDLDLAGDADFLNFIAGAEGRLPLSFFDGKDDSGVAGRPFQFTKLEVDGVIAGARPLLAKTRDLRLLVLLAKYAALGRELGDFIIFVRAMAALLSEQWDAVHPRGEDGDFSLRMVTVEAIDALPTVVMPLQYLPLIEHERFGSISYRDVTIARGKLAPRENESIDLAAVEKILNEASLSQLTARRDQLMTLEEALKQILKAWQANSDSGPSVALDRLPVSVVQIYTMLDEAIAKRDPAAALNYSADGGAKVGGDASGSQSAIVVGNVKSATHAANALAAAARYFSSHEPSNPALLLVGQASALLGKSFLEVLRILVPAQVEKAAINIGKEQFFDLPVERLSPFAET